MIRTATRSFTTALAALLLIGTPKASAAIYNLDAQNMLGPTGYVRAPSARVMGKGVSSLALHKFFMGLSRGWFRRVEAGVSFDLEEITPVTPFTRATFKARAPYFSFHGKYQFLGSERTGAAGAVGIWRHTYYLMLAPPTFYGFRVEGGPNIRRRTDDTHAGGAYGALSYTRGVQSFFGDFDSQMKAGALGWRYLISDAIRMDLFVTNIGRRQIFFERVFFGLTIAR